MPEVWAPSPDEVKALLPQRMQGRAFSASSVPNIAQVQEITDELVQEIVERVGTNISTTYFDQAKRVARFYVACHIERMFWPEQNQDASFGATPSGATSSSGTWYCARFTELFERLYVAINGVPLVDPTLEPPVPALTGNPKWRGPVPYPNNTDEILWPLEGLRF